MEIADIQFQLSKNKRRNKTYILSYFFQKKHQYSLKMLNPGGTLHIPCIYPAQKLLIS
jgi:hypothetical protein